MRKNAKVLKKRRKNTSKKEDPKKTPKRVPGGPENQLFRARDDFFIPRRAFQTDPERPKFQKVGKIELQRAGRKKSRKSKSFSAPDRRNARCRREVRRVKTLRVLQGSVRTLHQLWISAGILQDSVQDLFYASV